MDDKFAGRKLKCPKCRTRVRHRRDGTFELLSVGQAPASAPAGGGGPAPGNPLSAPGSAAPPASAPPPVSIAQDHETTVTLVPELVGKFVSQSESKQNVVVVWGVVGLLAVVLSGCGLAFGDPLLTVAPIAGALTAFALWLSVRVRRRRAQAAKDKAARSAKGEATEPLPKV